jgi:flavoprotein
MVEQNKLEYIIWENCKYCMDCLAAWPKSAILWRTNLVLQAKIKAARKKLIRDKQSNLISAIVSDEEQFYNIDTRGRVGLRWACCSLPRVWR